MLYMSDDESQSSNKDRSWSCTHSDHDYQDMNFTETCTKMVSGSLVTSNKTAL
jgi:hypothetical protein